jgi:hypothetical protein
MNDTIIITVGCLYIAGIIVAYVDGVMEERNERDHANDPRHIDEIRKDAIERANAARRRIPWVGVWPVLLIMALWRLRHENRPRHESPRHHR